MHDETLRRGPPRRRGRRLAARAPVGRPRPVAHLRHPDGRAASAARPAVAAVDPQAPVGASGTVVRRDRDRLARSSGPASSSSRRRVATSTSFEPGQRVHAGQEGSSEAITLPIPAAMRWSRSTSTQDAVGLGDPAHPAPARRRGPRPAGQVGPEPPQGRMPVAARPSSSSSTTGASKQTAWTSLVGQQGPHAVRPRRHGSPGAVDVPGARSSAGGCGTCGRRRRRPAGACPGPRPR